MGLLSIGGVAALAWMAERYSSALERRGADPRVRPGAARGVLPQDAASAERLVDAYLGVRRALDAARAEPPAGGAPPRSTREVLDAALSAERLTLEQYREVDRLVHAWRQGAADLPAAYRGVLERRRELIAAFGD